MPGSKSSSRDRVRAHRARLRSQGFRPIQIWVPDVTNEAFRAEVRRQSLEIANCPHDEDDQAFIDSVSILNEE